MEWYRVGTVSVSNGSKTVNGSGTLWVDSGVLFPGDIFVVDGVQYEIDTINNNTQLVLIDNFAGSTASGKAYQIIPIGLLPSTLALQVKQTMSDASAALDAAAHSVRYDTDAQGLDSTQQANARANIDAFAASGGTMTGAIVLHADASAAMNPVTKQQLAQCLPYQTTRDFENGTLIRTSIDFTPSVTTNDDVWLLEIEGNGYYTPPFSFVAQGYCYQNAIIGMAGISSGEAIPDIVAFSYEGKLCFWFSRISYWQGFRVSVYDVRSRVDLSDNKVVSVEDSTKPSGISMEGALYSYIQKIYSGVGALLLGADGSAPMHAVTKQQLDAAISALDERISALE